MSGAASQGNEERTVTLRDNRYVQRDAGIRWAVCTPTESQQLPQNPGNSTFIMSIMGGGVGS